MAVAPPAAAGRPDLEGSKLVFAGRAPPAQCVKSTAEHEIAKPHARDWTRRGLVDPEALHGEGGECGQRNEGGGDLKFQVY